MSQVTFGNITLPHGLALAPLAGVSDRAFRRVCRACGADFTVSEMVSAKALCYEQDLVFRIGIETKRLLDANPDFEARLSRPTRLHHYIF